MSEGGYLKVNPNQFLSDARIPFSLSYKLLDFTQLSVPDHTAGNFVNNKVKCLTTTKPPKQIV